MRTIGIRKTGLAGLVGSAFLAALSLGASATAGDVNITIEGVREADGALLVSLQTAEQFMKEEATRGEIIESPEAGSHTITFAGVADGDYAVSVWHDINGNKEFDTAPQGWPLDGWSMVNAASMAGPPTFDAVKFSVEGGADITLQMIYPPQ